ncbi:MAG: DUF1801 domain-containing protein [Gammaproteobacteria bacterium]|nr:DUF1801 domain-containing protein [Gammaproteobacteria bacterium]
MKTTVEPAFHNQAVAAYFDACPPALKSKLLLLRRLIVETAETINSVDKLEETLKWGEPAYLTRHGSTIRIAVVKASQTRFAMFFNCKTNLIDTFREIYRDTFNFEGNRAIVFSPDEDIAADALKDCIAIALTYHKRKHLPLLGC